MSINSVPRVDFNVVKSNKERYAKEFSEGCKKLETTLLSLWNDNIETRGCCKGHKSKKSVGYIGIDLKNAKKIVNLLSSLDKEDIRFSIVRLKEKYGVSIKKYNEKEIYDNIINSIGKKQYNKKIDIIIKNILNYKLDYYLNIHFFYKNNRLKKCHFITNDPNIINKYKNKYECEYMPGKLVCFESNNYLNLFD